jgi:ATP-dependent helicase/nuclease subunit A
MQFCDLQRAEAGVREEAERLILKGFINKESADLIYEDELQRFFTSDLYRRMNGAKNAGRLFYREFRFNIGLDAADFTTDPDLQKKLANETLLVQGVVDCFFEEEDGTVTVCDYKTDRVRKNGVGDFKARHRLQLTYYKKAIERITKKKVGRLVLYSFCLGEEISL